MSKPKTFTDDFKSRIAKIEAEGKELGLNWTSICDEAGVSRATPDRWKKGPPKTIQVVEKMEAVVEAHRRAKEAA